MEILLNLWWGLVALYGIASQAVESLFRKKSPPCEACAKLARGEPL